LLGAFPVKFPGVVLPQRSVHQFEHLLSERLAPPRRKACTCQPAFWEPSASVLRNS
jgi:hypothetical protein